MDIKYIERADIDRLKWDSCVHYARKGNPYGYTWYLDNVAENWSGLVEGDYKSVFPLVWNTKLLGYKQLYQPFFCQRHGVYSTQLLSVARIKAFLEAIPKEYCYIHIHTTHKKGYTEVPQFEAIPKSNYILYLLENYETLRKGYSSNLKRSLKKASKANLRLTGNIKPEKLVELYKTHQGPKMPELTDEAYHAAHRIIYNCLHRGSGFLSGVENEKGELIAAGFFIHSHKRIINLMPSTTPEGRDKCAMHKLLDTLIMTNAGRPIHLDFEGSSIPSIARFYQNFGAKEETYLHLKQDKLPWWMKKLRTFKR